MKYLLVLITTVLMNSCTPTVYQLETICEKDAVGSFKEIAKIMQKNGFAIYVSEVSLGSLIAGKQVVDGTSTFDWTWTINFISGKLSAQYKHTKKILTYYHQSAYYITKVEYLNDETDLDDKDYWDVRNAIQSLCNSKIKWIELEANTP